MHHAQMRDTIILLLTVQPLNHVISLGTITTPCLLLFIGDLGALTAESQGSLVLCLILATLRAWVMSANLLRGSKTICMQDLMKMDSYVDSQRKQHVFGGWKKLVT